MKGVRSQTYKKPNVGGRPKGSTEQRMAIKKTIQNMFELEKWVNENFDDAKNVLTEILHDKDASPTVRKGVAETIITLHNKFYVDHTVSEESQDFEYPSEDEPNRPILSLVCKN